MIEVKTAELIGPALDWAVAQAEGFNVAITKLGFQHDFRVNLRCTKPGLTLGYNYRPSNDWSQCGPLIEKHKAQVLPNDWPGGAPWLCWLKIVGMPRPLSMHGETPLVAACRAIVAAHSGDTVQIPDELAERVGQ